MRTNDEWMMEIVSECFHCGYHYKAEGEQFPNCHFDGIGLAPCEQVEADDYYEDEDGVLSDFYDFD